MIQELLARRIDPVRVLEDDEQGPIAGEPQQLLDQCFEDAVFAPLRRQIQSAEVRLVGDR